LPLANDVFTATLDEHLDGQCVSCAYKAPSLSGNDGTIMITSQGRASTVAPEGEAATR